MRTLIAATAALATLTAASASQAQILLQADNPSLNTFAQTQSGAWPLDGSSTQLSFRTTKANEPIELSFSGLCGVRQTGPNNDTGALATTTYVQAIFSIDGNAIIKGGLGNQLCLNTVEPSFNGYIQQAGGIVRLATSVPTSGLHILQVVVTAGVDANGSNLNGFLGQTHVSVAH